MVLGHFGHGHFGLGRFGLDISATDVSATENAKGGRFGQNHKFWVWDVFGVSTQLQSSGLVAHENSTFRNLALAVSGPFMA